MRASGIARKRCWSGFRAKSRVERSSSSAYRPAVPRVKNTGWVRNPIDAFIAIEHQERGLTPRPEAPRAILVRRVYLDLIGLPPTRDELRAAASDQAVNGEFTFEGWQNSRTD